MCVGVANIMCLVLRYDLVRWALKNHSTNWMWLGGKLAGFRGLPNTPTHSKKKMAKVYLFTFIFIYSLEDFFLLNMVVS